MGQNINCFYFQSIRDYLENRSEPVLSVREENKILVKNMSKQVQTRSSESIFDVCRQNAEKYFENTESNVPQYAQSFTGVQEEWFKACKNAVTSTISLQQEFAKKTGIDIAIPEAAKNAMIDTNKQILKVKSVQNQIVQATAKAIQQNIKTCNENAAAFTDLNKNILQSWISTFSQLRN